MIKPKTESKRVRQCSSLSEVFVPVVDPVLPKWGPKTTSNSVANVVPRNSPNNPKIQEDVTFYDLEESMVFFLLKDKHTYQMLMNMSTVKKVLAVGSTTMCSR